MSEGVLKPEAELRSVAIAEATVVESIRNALSKIVDVVRELHEALMDLSKGMVESVKVRSDRIWEAKRRVLDELRNYSTHFIRVRLGLENRDLYLDIFKELRSLTSKLFDISCLLKELAIQSSPKSSSVSLAIDASKSIIESAESIIDATMTLLDNPRGSADLLERSFRSLNSLEAMYRESLSEESQQMRELLRSLLSFARSLANISENLKWIALQRL